MNAQRLTLICYVSCLAVFVGCDNKPAPPPTPPAPASTQTKAEAARKAMEERRRIAEQSGPSIRLPTPPAEDLIAMQMGKAPDPKAFKELSDDQKAILTKALEKLQGAELPQAEALQVLELASQNYGKQILEIVQAALKHPDEAVRIRALQLLERNGDSSVLKVASEAVKDPNPDVRLQAVMALRGQQGAEVAEIYKSMMKDPDPNVVLGTVDAAGSLPPGQGAAILGEAIRGSSKDAALLSINVLAGMHKKEIVPALFEGLDSPDPEVKANAENIVLAMVMELPASKAEALKWWEENQKNFDDNLGPIIDGQPPETIPDLPVPIPK